MADKKTKRCVYCGGAMWLDDDVVKCFSCSRPAKSEDTGFNNLTSVGQPKLPGRQGWSSYSKRDR